MDKMHDYLVAIKQTVAAHKFTKNHNGERKRNWMLCDCGYAGVNHNNGHETHQRNMRMAIQELSGTKMNSGPFLAMLFKYSSDYSEESYWHFFDSDEGLSTFKSIAAPAKADFDRVQNLHPKTLVSIFSNGSSKVSPHFHLAMQKVSELGDPGMPLYLKIRMAHSEQL